MMYKTQKVAYAILGLAVVAAIPALFIDSEGFSQIAIVLSVAMAVLFVGAAGIFLRSLTGFSKQLKRAYRWICVGIALLGVAQLQLPASVLMGNEEAWYTASLGYLYFVAVLTIFHGVRQFAKLFSIRNLSTSWLTGIVLAATCVLVRFVPHPAIVVTEAEFDTNNIGSLVIAVFFVLAILQIIQIKRVASAAYASALAWLAAGLALTTSAGVVFVIGHLLMGESDFFMDMNPAVVCIQFTLAGLAMLKSAHSFAVIQADATITSPVNQRKASSVSSIDIVTYAAGLASDTRAIDPLLDRVRILTATQQIDDLSSSDQETLLQVYLDLEVYLVNEEKVREFTRPALRAKIAQALSLHGNDNTFWARLPQIQ